MGWIQNVRTGARMHVCVLAYVQLRMCIEVRLFRQVSTLSNVCTSVCVCASGMHAAFNSNFVLKFEYGMGKKFTLRGKVKSEFGLLQSLVVLSGG